MYYGIIIFMYLLSSFFVNEGNDFYYYSESRITLQKKFTIISVVSINDIKAEDALSEIKGMLLNGDEVFRVSNNIFFISSEKRNNYEYYSEAINQKQNIFKFTSPGFFGESKKVSQMISDEFIVKLKELKDTLTLENFNSEKNVIIKNRMNPYTFILKTKPQNKKNALQISMEYYNSGLYEYAHPNFIYTGLLLYDPNDANYGTQWSLKNTGQNCITDGKTAYGDSTSFYGMPGADANIYNAWDVTKGNNSVTIAVFDTGVDSAHSDISANLITGFDPTSGTNSVKTDSWGHGTNTLGILGAVTNNSTGLAGIAGGNGTAGSSCKIMSFKFVNSSDDWTTDEIIATAFDTARVRGVHVISNSWGGGNPVAVLTDAINKCADSTRNRKGCVICFASGNDGSSPPFYPGRLPKVICVGGSTPYDQKKAPGTGNEFDWGGNYGQNSNGEDLDIVAPCIVKTTYSGGGYGLLGGTSSACPHIAGIAGLVFSVNIDFTAEQVKEYIMRGADKIENVDYSVTKTYGRWNAYTGYGRVNAYNSVKLAQGTDVTPPTINHKNIPSDNSTLPHTVTAEIIDQNGSAVQTSGTSRPKLSFRSKINSGNWSDFSSVYFSSSNGNQYSFLIPGFGHGTQIQYYIEASDGTGNSSKFPLHAGTDFTYTLCYFAIGNIQTDSAKIYNWTVNSKATAISSSMAMGNFIITDTKVSVYMRHADISTNALLLWSPIADNDNNRKCVFTYSSAFGTGINAVICDSAAKYWSEGSYPYSGGYFKPDYHFKGYNGTNANGNWKIIAINTDAANSTYYDSLKLYLGKFDPAQQSPCVRHNSAADTIVSFTQYPVQTISYYIYNDGNSDLNISSYSIQGDFGSKFSITNTPPSVITSGASGEFIIRLDTNAKKTDVHGSSVIDKNSKDSYESAVLTINNDDPSKAVFRVSLQTDLPLPVEISLFDYSVMRNDVILNWITESELNNQGFEILRKSKNDSASSWLKVGFINGLNKPGKYNFTDKSVKTGSYRYKLRQFDYNGNFNDYLLGNTVKVGIPEKFNLSQNYPNPFNPVSKFYFDIPFRTAVRIELFDITGKKIITLLNDIKEAGYYFGTIDGANLSSGIYFLTMEAGSYKGVIKTLLVK